MEPQRTTNDRQYDSNIESGSLPLPPGMDAAWFAREGINVLLNGGVSHAEQLFRKFRSCSPLLSSGASLVDFITAAMTFEDEKMDQAHESLRRTAKMCDIDSLFEGVVSKRPSSKWPVADRIERMIIWADCELFLSLLMFLKQSVLDFVKAGYHMRRAWKMYEKCHNEIHGSQPDNCANQISKAKKSGRSSKSPTGTSLSPDEVAALDSSLSFGFGLIQVALSIVPGGLLKICELIGFRAERDVGLRALELSSKSSDMKAPIAKLALLWYHTVVRPFCALDGNNIDEGLVEADRILAGAEAEFPTSAIFLYYKALVLRLRGHLDEALDVLNKTMETSKEQREIELLCCYDKGWCHMMKMEWSKAGPCFQQLKSNSRWSESYYTYLLAVAEGSQGQVDSAYRSLSSVPKLAVRKTQLENFLCRKALMFKRNPPQSDEYVVLGLELLYLWNALPQCREEGQRAMLAALDRCKAPTFQPIKMLIMGSLFVHLGDREAAEQYLLVASSKPDGKPADPHVVPYALYELAMLTIMYKRDFEQGRNLLMRVKEQFSGYDFENRLNFRIHAALNNLDDPRSLHLPRDVTQTSRGQFVDGL